MIWFSMDVLTLYVFVKILQMKFYVKTAISVAMLAMFTEEN